MKKKFGQHFLFDRNILNKIVNSSGVTGEDTVVEIGPGLGTLTNIIAERAKRNGQKRSLRLSLTGSLSAGLKKMLHRLQTLR
jgi:predicted methyltransferase